MRRLSSRHEERGQAIVEMALVIPIVILLMVGLFDLGRVVFINNSLSDGARHGARHGAVSPEAADYCTRVDGAVRSAIRGQELATYTVTYEIVNPMEVVTSSYVLCQGGANGPGRAAFISLLNGSATPGDRVTVDLQATVNLATPLVQAATGKTAGFTLQAKSTMQVTFVPET